MLIARVVDVTSHAPISVSDGPMRDAMVAETGCCVVQEVPKSKVSTCFTKIRNCTGRL